MKMQAESYVSGICPVSEAASHEGARCACGVSSSSTCYLAPVLEVTREFDVLLHTWYTL